MDGKQFIRDKVPRHGTLRGGEKEKRAELICKLEGRGRNLSDECITRR